MNEYDRDSVTIHHGDALDVLRQLPDGIVQTCVTSPPYWGLRTYGDWRLFSFWGDGVWCLPRKHPERHLIRLRIRASRRGIVWNCDRTAHVCAYGLEPTPELFINHTVSIFREVRRVLRDDGTLWLNLGDSYVGNSPGARDSERWPKQSRNDHQAGVVKEAPGLKPKDLCGIPWRVALALQADGWYLRSDIIWHKPNPMPESCADRSTKSHEYIFLMSKRARYYYDADAVREDTVRPGHMNNAVPSNEAYAVSRIIETGSHRNKRTVWECEEWQLVENTEHDGHKPDVWRVATKGYSGAHFATFPPRLIEPCILAGANDRACAECGKAWRRVVESERASTRPGENTKVKVPGGWDIEPGAHGTMHRTDRTEATYRDRPEVGNRDPQRHVSVRTQKGHEPDCKCGTKETKPSIVLDPFLGSGTTAEVARKHGCRCIGIELNAKYIDLAAKRLAQGTLEFV